MSDSVSTVWIVTYNGRICGVYERRADAQDHWVKLANAKDGMGSLSKHSVLGSCQFNNAGKCVHDWEIDDTAGSRVCVRCWTIDA
jgi:hypothetical protein